MSAILDSLLDDDRRAASNDAAMRPPLRAYIVAIGQRGSPRLEFAAMGRSSCDVVMQHICLAEVGERCEASPV